MSTAVGGRVLALASLWLGLLMVAGACAGPLVESGNKIGSARVASHEDPDDAANADDHDKGARATEPLVSLAELESPLIHSGSDRHKVAEVWLKTERLGQVEDDGRPLVARSSPLVHRRDDPHEIVEVALAPLGEHAPAAVAVAAAPPPRRALPAPVPTPSRADGTPPSGDPPPLLRLPTFAVVEGPLQSVQGPFLTVATANGLAQITVREGMRLEKEAAGGRSDLQPGQFVGVVRQPDGTATRVRVYSKGPGMPDSGIVPMQGADQGKLTVFGNVVAVQPSTLTVVVSGQTFRIPLTADLQVLKPVPATLAEVATGTRLVVSGTVGADDVLQANAANVVDGP